VSMRDEVAAPVGSLLVLLMLWLWQRYSSQLNAEWAFLSMLKDEGRQAAQTFLDAHGDNLGHRSSLDLDALPEQV
jgi:hypothetical protein